MSADGRITGLLQRFRGPDGRIPHRTRWIAVGLGVVVLLVLVLTRLLMPLIVLLGLIGIFFGAAAVITGSAGLARIRSRKAGALVAGISLFAVIIASSAQSSAQLPEPNTAGGGGSGFSAGTDPSGAPTATTTPTPSATPTPVATETEVKESTVVPFSAVTVEDNTIDVGQSVVTSTGVDGQKVTTYLVSYLDGVEVSRSVAREEITVQPVNEVTANGTRVPPPPAPPAAVSNGCDPNYDGACVPIASDVDCAGGSGNGPAYVAGPVRIIGSDIYDLDRDGDGIACDK